MVMTAIAQVLRDGGRLDWRDPTKPFFVVPRGQQAAVATLLTPTAKPATRHALALVAEYRRVCLALFRLNAHGVRASHTEARQALQDESRLVDDLGPDLADLIRTQAATDYRADAHLCPLCGGPEHDA